MVAMSIDIDPLLVSNSRMNSFIYHPRDGREMTTQLFRAARRLGTDYLVVRFIIGHGCRSMLS